MSHQNEKHPSQDASKDREYILQQYLAQINYYKNTGRYNKRAYKVTRYLTVILGALVTLIASLSSSSYVDSSASLSAGFAISTPILAALLAIVGGFSQNFQWGTGWKEMTLSTQQLQMEYDRLRITPADEVDATKELEQLHKLVLTETEDFFSRILGASKTSAHGPSEK